MTKSHAIEIYGTLMGYAASDVRAKSAKGWKELGFLVGPITGRIAWMCLGQTWEAALRMAGHNHNLVNEFETAIKGGK